MQILITSGGTSEPIDQVRSITNHASGRLGKLITEQALQRGHHVTLVTTKQAVKPSFHANLEIIEITNVEHLQRELEPLVKRHDVLIHSMAVSDYTPIYMTGFSEVAASSDLTAFLTQTKQTGKISSKEEHQVLFLKKTPKVVSYVKQWNPHILLVGFKLLVNVAKEELFSVARAGLTNYQADYVLANDLTDIDDEKHLAYLVDQTSETPARTKSEIASLLLTTLEERVHTNG